MNILKSRFSFSGMWNEPTSEELSQLPKLHETENIPLEEKVIHQHYFLDNSDWYIAEYDPKASIFFGYTIIDNNRQLSDWAYMSFKHLAEVNINGVEVDRDFYWVPQKAYEVDRIRALYKRCRNWSLK